MLPFAIKWMDFKGIMLSEICQDRERQILYILTYMRNLKNNKTKQRTHRNRKETSDCQRQGMQGR